MMVDQYFVASMMISHSFNPYTYYDTGTVQVQTRYEGQSQVDILGNDYYHGAYLDIDKW